VSKPQDDSDPTVAFLGRGWAFPPRWHRAVAHLETPDERKRREQDERKRREQEDEEPGHTAQAPVHMVLSAALRDIQEALRIILGTRKGERVMRPDFGSGLHEYVFAPNNLRTRNLIADEVSRAILMWERRVKDVEVRVDPSPEEPARLDISIDCKVETHRMRQSFIFPFYLQHPEGR